MKLLLGTSNTYKADFLIRCLKKLPIIPLTLSDLHLNNSIDETGDSPEENALIKAKGYFDLSNVPTLSSDSGLHFKELGSMYQPGVKVKRMVKSENSIGENGLLEYYMNLLKKVDKPVEGLWLIGVALVMAKNKITSKTISITSTFVKRPSPMIISGMPLLSLQIDSFGNYISENLENSRIFENLIVQIEQFVKTALNL